MPARAGIVGAIEFFRGHIERAVKKFCSGKGDGTLKRGFDERFDSHLYDPQFLDQLKTAGDYGF